MKEYSVRVSAKATVGVKVTVRAQSEEDAEAKAKAFADGGDALWEYEGVDHDTIETWEVAEE